jgi:transposase
MRSEPNLAEFGLVAATGREGLAQLAAIITDESNRELLPSAMKQALQTIVDQLTALELQIGTLDRAISAHHRANDMSCRLETVPGIGVIGATALASTVTDPSGFKTGRDFAAWIGLVPRQHSTGGKERLGGISKQGDRSIRRLLVIGATAVVRHARQHPQKHPWIMRLLAKKPAKLVAVAVANKMARIAWAIMAKRGYYRAPELAVAA